MPRELLDVFFQLNNFFRINRKRWRDQRLHPLVSDQHNETDRGYSYELWKHIERLFRLNRRQGADFQTAFLRFRNGIALRDKIPRPCIENRKVMKRLDDRDVIGVNRNRWIAWQSGVGARFVDDHACRCALGFVKDTMLEDVPAFIGKSAIGNIDAAQSGIIGDKRPGDGRWPREKPQPIEQVARRDPVCGVAAKTTWVTRPRRSLASLRLSFCC